MDTMKQPKPGSNSEEEHPNADRLMQEIAAGDEACLALLRAVWRFEQVYDDLIDRDRPVTIEQAAEVLVNFVREISFNVFWQEHSWQLFPLLVSAANRWVAAENSALGKEANAVLRCGDIDFFLQAAYCRGGWEHMQRVKEVRTYDL